MQPWSSAVLFTKEDNKNAQSINFPHLPDRNYEEGGLELKASSSSGLAMKFTVVSGPATVSGNKVSIINSGSIIIEASQAGNGTFQAASPVSRSFNVIKKEPNQSNEEVLYRINSGGPSFTFEGEKWLVDSFYEGGMIFQVSSVSIYNTENDVLYLSERFGDFSYSLPVPEAGFYKVDLHFAEIHWDKIGSRIFDFKIENEQYKIEHLDIYKESGGLYSSITYSADQIMVNDGFLDINWITRKNNSKISGITLYKITNNYGSKVSSSKVFYPQDKMELTKLEPGTEANKMTLYPNPTKEKFFLDLHVDKTADWGFTLYDSKGVSVFKENRYLEPGKHTLEFKLSSPLNPGIYYFNINNIRDLYKPINLILI